VVVKDNFQKEEKGCWNEQDYLTTIKIQIKKIIGQVKTSLLNVMIKISRTNFQNLKKP